MQHYIDVVQDRSGNAIGNAIVTVKNNSSGQTAPTYSDSAGLIPLTSIMTANNGTFSFYIESGRYNISITKNGVLLNAINDIFITVTADYPTAMSQYDAIAGINLTSQTISADVLQGAMPTAMSYADAVAGTSTTPQSIAPNVLVTSNIVQKYASVNNIPANFVGIAKVGTDLYVGDGTNLNKDVSSVYLSSSNTASQNTAAIQSALDLAGDVYIVGDGVRLVNATLIIKSNTNLRLSNNLILKLADNSNTNLILNYNFNARDGSGWRSISSITATSDLLATIVCPNHGFVTGDYVFTNGANEDYYNDIKPITYVDANTFTIELDRVAGFGFSTPATYTTTTVTGTTTIGSKIINSVSSVANLSPGMIVTGTGIPANSYLNNINSETQITIENTGATASGSVTLTCSYPLRCCKADANITISGGCLDGNAPNQTVGDTYAIFTTTFRHVSDMVIRDIRTKNSGNMSFKLEGGYRCTFERIHVNEVGGSSNQSNGIQMLGAVRDVIIKNITGSTKDDFCSYCAKDYPQYSDLGASVGNASNITWENITPSGCLSVVKILPNIGFFCKNIKLKNIDGRHSNITWLSIIYDTVNTGTNITGSKRSLGVVDNVDIDGVYASQITAGSVLITASVSINTLSVNNVTLKNVPTGFKLMSQTATSVIDVLKFNNINIQSVAGVSQMTQFQGNINYFYDTNSVYDGVYYGYVWETSAGPNTAYSNGIKLFASNILLKNSSNLFKFNGQQGIKGWFNNIVQTGYAGVFWENSGSPQATLYLTACDTLGKNNSPQFTFNGAFNNADIVWQDSTSHTIASSATIAINMVERPKKIITLSTNTTISNPTGVWQYNMQDGKELTIIITQDATGGRTVAWDTQYSFPIAYSNTGNTAGKSIILKFAFVQWSSKWVCISGTPTWV